MPKDADVRVGSEDTPGANIGKKRKGRDPGTMDRVLMGCCPERNGCCISSLSHHDC